MVVLGGGGRGIETVWGSGAWEGGMDLLRLGHKASLELDLNSELIGNKDREIFVWMRRRRKCSLSPNI